MKEESTRVVHYLTSLPTNIQTGIILFIKPQETDLSFTVALEWPGFVFELVWKKTETVLF